MFNRKVTSKTKFFQSYTCDFYLDSEIDEIKKVLLDLKIKLNIFELKPTAQACFWFIFFNFMSPITAEIELNTARRKILADSYCRKGNPDSRTLQNTIKKFTDIGILVEKKRNQRLKDK